MKQISDVELRQVHHRSTKFGDIHVISDSLHVQTYCLVIAIKDGQEGESWCERLLAAGCSLLFAGPP